MTPSHPPSGLTEDSVTSLRAPMPEPEIEGPYLAKALNSREVGQRGARTFVLLTREDDEGVEKTTELSAKIEICGCCSGKGTHVNPAIDGHGLSQEEMDEDPDFREDYFAGKYDVSCEDCGGTGRVAVVDWTGHPELAQQVAADLREDREYHAMVKAEKDFGC